MELDLTPLRSALTKLNEGLARYESDTSDEQIRDGLIQRFEFTYELAHKMLKRYLRDTAPTLESIDELSFQGLIRLGNDKGVLQGDWSTWSGYREMRAKTSHTYDEIIAIQVVKGMPSFIAEVEFLLGELETRCQK